MDTPLTPLPSAEQLRQLLHQNELDKLRMLLGKSHPADIADVLEELDGENAVKLFELLPDFEASEVLDEANSLLTAELIEQVDDERLADLLDTLPMDDAAELLEDVPEQTAERLLGLMEAQEAREVREILSYPENSAGRLMSRDIAALRAPWSVAQALDYLRALTDTETLHYLYVVDAVGHLTGVVPIRKLILAQADAQIADLTEDVTLSVSAETDQEELAEAVSKYDYTAIPVVDGTNTLLGVVTVDDVLDIVEEEATEDIQLLGGSAPLEQPYFSASIPTMVRKRVGWLILLFFASFLSSFVVRSYENLTTAFKVLPAFIPLITGTGGNAGSQTVATIIRAIAVGEIRLTEIGRTVLRETTVGLLMGVLLGLGGLVYAAILGVGWQITLVIGLTLPLIVVWSTLVATLIPLIAEQFESIDATVVSAPMITTIVDATGLLIYFGIASLILR